MVGIPARSGEVVSEANASGQVGRTEDAQTVVEGDGFEVWRRSSAGGHGGCEGLWPDRIAVVLSSGTSEVSPTTSYQQTSSDKGKYAHRNADAHACQKCRGVRSFACV